jgi:hypothetical protein
MTKPLLNPSKPQLTPEITADALRTADSGKRLRRLAWLLDSSIRLPGGFRIGADGLIGLVPGVGDLLAALLSSYIVIEAARMKVPGSVLMRMVGNIALEMGIGLVPLAGDLFDFVFKANMRNVQLIETYLDQPRATRRRSRWQVAAALLALAAVVGAVLALVFGLLWLAASALVA